MDNKLTSIFSHLMGIAVVLIAGLLLAFQPPIEPGKLKVSGKVKNENNRPLDSAMVIITDSTGKVGLDTIYCNEKGKFSFDLEYNGRYRTYYSKEGYVSVYDEYNTDVPESKLYKELVYSPVRNLFTDSSNFNERAAARFPLSKVSFNKAYDGFFEDFESVTAFLDEVTKPNVGEMVIAGTFRDTLTDSFNVRVVALDTLGFELASTESDENGNYSVTIPLMSKVKLKFISEDHYESFAMVNSTVPSDQSGDDFNLNQDFVLVNTEDSMINDEAFDNPIARIEHLDEMGSFVENPAVAAVFNDELLVSQRRIILTGVITDNNNSTINNTTVTVKDGPRVIDQVVVDSNTFTVKLPYGAIAHVHFLSNNYHESFISFNTNLTPEEMQDNKELTTEVELYSRERTDINPIAFNYPAAKYYYDRDLEEYAQDSVVTDDFIVKLESPIEVADSATSEGLLVVRGGVIDPGNANKKVPEARIRILDENKQLTSSFNTDKKGRYQIKLGLNKVYYLEVEKEEYLATQIKFDTKVPAQYTDTTLEQIGVALPITHPENEIGGKKIPQGLLQEQEVTAFYIDQESLEFKEDEEVFDKFAQAVVDYTDEIPAVTMAQIEEEKQKKAELEAAAIAAAAKKAAENEAARVPTIAMAGVVMDENNKPLEGVTVSLKENKKVLEKTKTDSSGNYKIIAPVQKEMDMVFEDKGLYTVKASVSTMYDDSVKPQDANIVLPPLVAYSESNVGINSDAFENDWQKITYDPSTLSFKQDEATTLAYTEVLNSTPDNQYLVVSGRAKDQNGRNIDGAQVVVRANGQIIKTVFSDKKGRYDFKLEYQKNYRVEVKKDGYKSTFAAVSTKTNSDEKRLIDKKVKSFNLLLVSRDEENINDKVFYRPYARVAFDSNSNEFVEVTSVNNNFLADLYIEVEKDGKKEYQLQSETVAASFEVSEEKGYKEYVNRAGASKEAAQKRSQNKNAAGKAASPFMGDFFNAINGMQASRRTKIRDVNLTLNEIYNVRLDMSKQPKLEVDENLIDVNKQKDLMNNIIASALGMRKDADLVSTDSTLQVDLGIRIRHSNEGVPLYAVSRDIVYIDGEKVDYVETTDWFLWQSRYKNNQEISESQYIAELDSLKSIGYMIN